MCLYPKLVRNPKYTSNKKNGGNIPPINDIRVGMVPIGCQQCIECRKQKSREWQVRLNEEVKSNTNGHFITLTLSNEAYKQLYNDLEIKLEGYDLDNQIMTLAIRRFLERWRKKYKRSVRHWLVTELGHQGTENIHVHGILWTEHGVENLKEIWQYGYVWNGYTKNGVRRNYVNSKTVNYICKYVSKQDFKHRCYKPKIFTSAGIGNQYTKSLAAKQNKYNGQQTREYYRTQTGHKLALPIYYRNKIYSDTERELLWLQRLDKEERWVLGQKIDISKSDKAYIETLKEAQIKNVQLGYNHGRTSWRQQDYEKERRQILNKKRLMPPAAPSAGLSEGVFLGYIGEDVSSKTESPIRSKLRPYRD